MNEELKACPKCQSSLIPSIVEDWDDGVMYYYFKCHNCMYRTHEYCDLDLAKKEWNETT